MAAFGSFVAGQVLTAAELNAAGTWQDYTPSWTQSATITKTVNFARYTQFNKIVMGSVKMTATSAGTANNKVLVGLPVAASSNQFILGQMTYFDDSATDKYLFSTPMMAFYETSTTISFSPKSLTVTGPPNATADDKRFGQDYTASGTSRSGVTVASGDIIWIQFQYEAS
jgi:hypothetical protein